MSMAALDDILFRHEEGALEAHYKDKPDEYFSGARDDFIKALPVAPHARILEIGCGSGATGVLALNEKRCGKYVGIELDQRAARQAQKHLSDVHIGNVEEMEFDWPTSYFDALILSEVLEHLIDPWSVMKRLAPLIRPGGMVMASSPNISHYAVIMELMKGNWNLADEGVMDRTHMRWFTPKTFRAVFENTGFRIEKIHPLVPFSGKAKLISRLSSGCLDHLFMRQIVVHGRRV